MAVTTLTDTTSLALRFLGAPRFERGGQPADLTAAKPVAVLTYLALTGASHPREHILDLLWTDSPVESGRKNLRNALWTLRKSLGDDVLRTSGEYLSLADDIWTDVRALERAAAGRSSANLDDLRSAIELYRGPLADGLVLDYAPEFELWLTSERERLANLYLQVLDTLVEARKAAGDWTGVIALARQGLKHHPWQESLYYALIEAHAQRGERSEALRQYEALRLVLDREMGIEPLPETQALRDAVMHGMSSVIPSTDSKQSSTVQVAAPSASRENGRHARAIEEAQATQNQARGGVPFINRVAERSLLNEELEAASRGQARIVLLTGELGIGKSRLWEEWSAGLGEGVTVLQTRSFTTVRTVPLAPLFDLFSHAAIGGEFRPQAQAPDLLATFESYVQYLLDFGARPLIIFIDDLQWADEVTLEWLGYMVHRLREHPLLLVGTYQLEGVSPTLVQLVADWLRRGMARRLPLERLSKQEASAIIAACGCPSSVAEQVLLLGMGNPYFLIELCKGVRDAGSADPLPVVPEVLADLIRARLDRLPLTSREVARAAAVLPPSFPFNALWQVSGLDELEAVDALDMMVDVGMLCEQDGAYAFAHPLVRVTVLEGLTEARRDLLVRRLAGAPDTSQRTYRQETTSNGLNLPLTYAVRAGAFAQT